MIIILDKDTLKMRAYKSIKALSYHESIGIDRLYYHLTRKKEDIYETSEFKIQLLYPKGVKNR